MIETVTNSSLFVFAFGIVLMLIGLLCFNIVDQFQKRSAGAQLGFALEFALVFGGCFIFTFGLSMTLASGGIGK